jgi:membrane fusion protein, multidrug efflux system
MSEKALKIVPAPESRTLPEAKTETSGAKGLLARVGRKRLRMILLVGLPALALLSGGRYSSTDNAYVGAQKVLITPDISGKIVNVSVREVQHVNPGDEAVQPRP